MDGLRGLAALGVMLFHYLYFFPVTYALGTKNQLAFWGQFGVQLFFMISGFVIFMVVSQKPDAIAFGLKRLIRLYPTFWFCCLFTIVITFFMGGTPFSIGQILINLTMLAGFFKIPYIDGSYWSLIPELIFYFSIFVFLLFKQQKNIYYWGLGFLFLSVIGRFFLPKELIFILNLKWLPFFWIGINLFLLTKNKNNYLSFVNIILSLISIVVIFQNLYLLLATSLCLLVLIAATNGWLKFLSTRPLVFLGAISFPLYLLHQVIGLHLIKAFSVAGMDVRISIAITMAVIIIFAYLVHIIIEQPSIELGKKINRKVFLKKTF